MLGMMGMRGRLLILAWAMTLSGCVLPELSLEGRQCPCAPGWYCQRGACLQGAADAEAPGGDSGLDAGVAVDSGVEGPDAGRTDADAPDALTPDTGGDAGPVDSGPLDAGPDAGPVDSGPLDAGVDGGVGPVSCASDVPCDPPRTVCEGGTCAPGCANGGAACVGNATCDPTTGRCFDAAAVCGVASDCGPGAPYMVCEGGRCRYGCGVPFAADCGDVDFVCTAGHCTRRCDGRSAYACLGNSTCNSGTGRCEGASPLGLDCTQHADCSSGHCLSITSPSAQSFCSRACGGTADCPRDMSCLQVDGASLCIREAVFSPRPQMDDPSGDACANPGNTCQSLLCVANVCTERCTSDQQCDAFGTPCVTVTISGAGGTLYIPQCVAPTGALPHGAVCPNDDDTVCARGVCNRYTDRCEQGCCSSQDCAPSERCLVYDLAFDSPYTTCQPRAGAGSAGLGVACAGNAASRAWPQGQR